jgi:hypothetical protein
MKIIIYTLWLCSAETPVWECEKETIVEVVDDFEERQLFCDILWRFDATSVTHSVSIHEGCI